MARYFQHLNPNEQEFQKVTELQYIDDSDPTFVLYYFKDGTKCNKDFIGSINEKEVFGKKEFVEVLNPNNIWEFKITEVKDSEPQYAITASGERVEIPDLHMYTQPGEAPIKRGKSVSVVKQPAYVPDSILKKMQSDDTYNFNTAPIPEKAQDDHIAETKEIVSNNTTETSEVVVPVEKESTNTFAIDADTLIANNIDIEFVHHGHNYKMKANDFFNNAITPIEEKVIEKVIEVKKEVEVCEDTHIEIGISDEQKVLMDNMIDMSQKEQCDIAMDITLTLPPISVYQLIKNVYPAGMSNGFVNIIADRMQIKELKKAVASGLLLYYDEDADVVVEQENSKEDQFKNQIIENSTLETQVLDTEKVTAKKKSKRVKNA